MKLKLFQYAIVLHPEANEHGKFTENSKMVKDPEFILAADEKQAGLLVARAIPECHIDKLDRIEVLVRPF